MYLHKNQPIAEKRSKCTLRLVRGEKTRLCHFYTTSWNYYLESNRSYFCVLTWFCWIFFQHLASQIVCTMMSCVCIHLPSFLNNFFCCRCGFGDFCGGCCWSLFAVVVGGRRSSRSTPAHCTSINTDAPRMLLWLYYHWLVRSASRYLPTFLTYINGFKCIAHWGRPQDAAATTYPPTTSTTNRHYLLSLY